MNLELTNTMPIGKHKGTTIEEILKEDPGYLVWMRQAKSDNGDRSFFSPSVSKLLDSEIRKSKQLRSKYKVWELPDIAPVTPQQVQAAEARAEMAYGGWGVF